MIYDPNKEKYGNNILDQRLLYVSLTRALHSEYVIAREEITELIEC